MNGSDSLLDCAPIFFLSVGDDGRIVLANKTLAERIHCAPDELIGRHVETILTRAGRLFYQTHVFPLIKMHGSVQEVFLLVETKEGEPFGTLWNAVRRTDDGVVRIDCVLMEVHERRKYEDALLQAKRSAEAANALLEQQSTVLTNQAAELEAQHQQLLDQASELEAQAAALRQANDELRTRGEALEQERAAAHAAQQAADVANRAKSDFLATMSHELRTPLNAIGGYAELMEMGIRGPVTPAQREDLHRIQVSQRHLLGLINEVLNYAKVETGTVRYDLASVRVRDVLAAAEALVAPQTSAKGLRLTIGTCPPDLAVRADAEKLRQILVNLLSNALKFTERGGRIALECVASASRVEITVRDSGIGIPTEQLERIFEPFVQVRADLTRTAEGTGLGLAISRDLARGMGGELVVSSAMGQGSTFTLSLPRSPA